MSSTISSPLGGSPTRREWHDINVRGQEGVRIKLINRQRDTRASVGHAAVFDYLWLKILPCVIQLDLLLSSIVSWPPPFPLKSNLSFRL